MQVTCHRSRVKTCSARILPRQLRKQLTAITRKELSKVFRSSLRPKPKQNSQNQTSDLCSMKSIQQKRRTSTMHSTSTMLSSRVLRSPKRRRTWTCQQSDTKGSRACTACLRLKFIIGKTRSSTSTPCVQD